jgi:hypothetical protein
MPICLAKTPEQREHEDRWELIVGKELKDWATRVMKRDGISRKEARMYLLNKINSMDRPLGERISKVLSSFSA